MIPLPLIIEQLHTDIMWSRFARIICAVGSSLNQAQSRGIKGKVIERGLEDCSQGTLRYVGDMEPGCDFIYRTTQNIRIEMKFDATAIYTDRGYLRKNTSIKLMNSHGSNQHTALPPNYADFLMVASRTGVSIIEKEVFSQYLIFKGDGILTKFPTSLSTILVGPDIMTLPYEASMDIEKELDELIMKFIRSVE